jgi:hypothetical protein
MRITAAIPTYRRPGELRRCLESVLGQRREPDRIVVGDDAADPDTEEVCRSFRDPRLTYVARRPLTRMTDNWDFVMRWAADGLVALLEDDNIWLPDHLEHAERTLIAFPEASLYHEGHHEARLGDGRFEVTKVFSPPWHEGCPPIGRLVSTKSVILDALACGSINSSTVVVRREVMERVPRFDPRFLMGMDTLQWARIAMVAPVVYGPWTGVVYTYHGENVSLAEVQARRAGRQARGARRVLLHEALAAGLIDTAVLDKWLRVLPPAEAAFVLTMFAHRETAVEVRRVAKSVWRDRREVRCASGYLRASRVLGFMALAHADTFDALLGFGGRLCQSINAEAR